ncbi:MAG: hypothetical protein E7213_05805 [Clostridium sp.]|nr:hypothetical protein [Clostridium sp.]
MNIIKLELKKIFKCKCIYIGILLSLIIGGIMTYTALNNPQFFKFKHTQAFFCAYFMQVTIIYLIVDNVYSEYNQGTLKLLSNNNLGLNKVFINKLICILITSIFLAVINIIFNIISFIVLSPDINILNFLLERLITYLLFALAVYSTVILIFSLYKKNLFTLCFLILLFYLSHDFIDALANKMNISQNILDFICFYALGSGMQGFYFNTSMVIGTLVWSTICLLTGLYIISKQDIC